MNLKLKTQLLCQELAESHAGFSSITRPGSVNGRPEVLTKDDEIIMEVLPQGNWGIYRRDDHPGAVDIDKVRWMGWIPNKKATEMKS